MQIEINDKQKDKILSAFAEAGNLQARKMALNEFGEIAPTGDKTTEEDFFVEMIHGFIEQVVTNVEVKRAQVEAASKVSKFKLEE
jgi:hypothetical protein